MTKESAAAMGSGSIDWALASKQHDGYVNALSKIVDSVEVRITVGTAGRFVPSIGWRSQWRSQYRTTTVVLLAGIEGGGGEGGVLSVNS